MPSTEDQEPATRPGVDRPTPPDERGLGGLVRLMAVLRGPGGCPWDAAQTHASLVRYLLEECHELVEAIEAGARDDLLEELGDVLYQVLFHADIASHTPGEEFDLDDIADRTFAKMVGRHPHVFADRAAADADAVTGFWEELKRAEKPERTSVLDGIAPSMPSLLLADKLVGRAADIGLTAAPRTSGEPPADEEVLGDLLLGIVAEAKSRGLDAERALRTRLRRLTGDVARAEAARSGSTPTGMGE